MIKSKDLSCIIMSIRLRNVVQNTDRISLIIRNSPKLKLCSRAHMKK